MARGFIGVQSRSVGDDYAWPERCQYWAKPIPESGSRGTAPRRVHRPLVLTGHGVGLRVNQGALLVRDGFTHHPQVQAIHRFFPRDRRMPSRIIIVDGNGNITLDALSWLTEQNVPLVRIDWQGNVTTVIGKNPAPDHRLVRAQLAAQADEKVKVRIAVSLVLSKIQCSIETLKTFPASERVESGIDKLQEYLRQLRRSPPKSIQALLGLEGGSAKSYFNAWQGLSIRWKGTGRYPCGVGRGVTA